MSANDIKTKIHNLVESTTDETVLQDVYLQLTGNKDWWETLSDTQKQRITESEIQYKNGKTVSNEVVLQKIQQWLQK